MENNKGILEVYGAWSLETGNSLELLLRGTVLKGQVNMN